jgi:hypothetical protein
MCKISILSPHALRNNLNRFCKNAFFKQNCLFLKQKTTKLGLQKQFWQPKFITFCLDVPKKFSSFCRADPAINRKKDRVTKS